MADLKSVARTLLHRAGGLSLIREWNRRSLRILMYHSFGPWRPGLRAELDRRCAHLRACYTPVSLTAVARAWTNGDPLPANAIAVTVDDGYRDFYEIAYPAFARYSIPVTVYLVSDFMDGGCWLWTDRLRYIAENATPPLSERATAALSAVLKRMPDAARRSFLAALPELTGVRVPPEPPLQWSPLSWHWAREMAAHGIDFGAHTRSHPILSRVTDAALLRDEIEGSKKRIEEMLERPVLHFCYPNGRGADVSDAAVEEVRRAGFATAVLSEPGFNYRGADLHRLKRVPADPAYPEQYFHEYVAGVHAR